jgi:acetyltransferase
MTSAPVELERPPFARAEPALDSIFAPQNVAVIGATDKPGSVGRTVLKNLVGSPFGGAVFPINPKRASVLGIKAYPRLADVTDSIDLAVVVTPATQVPGVVGECADHGVRGVIVISAGFKEVGPEGVELERRTLDEARRGGIRLIGPNCLGVMNPRTGLNATFAATIAQPGHVAFISQSGALCAAVLDWSLRSHVGFSAFASIGSMLDVDWGDLIDYLGNDPQTHSIVLYMETIGNARSFLSAARKTALDKPIIVIKPGRTEGAARAAASHTGSLAGSDAVLDAAFRRSGVLRVATIAELFYMADILAKQPRPRGPRLTIVTNAGGPGVLATDALLQEGGELAALAPETVARLDEFLPPHWSHANPIDILGDGRADRYAKTLEIVARDPGSDGLLVVLTPQAMSDPAETAEVLRPYARPGDRPVLASWMGASDIEAGEAILNGMDIPTFRYPDTAARMFAYMWKYTDNLRQLYETPSLSPHDGHEEQRAAGTRLVSEARRRGRTLLTEAESKALLTAYGIPTVRTEVALSADEAIQAAEAIGFPVVLKLHSETVTHKTDVGGVRLGLNDAAAVRDAYDAIEDSVSRAVGWKHFLGVTVQPMVAASGYELILGSSVDPQFGPVLLFGSGGTLVEVYEDRALGLPPLTTTLARRMIERTKIARALRGTRGRAAIDQAALEQLMVAFSRLVVEQPGIREIDINPLLASAERIVALDARVVLHGSDVADEQLPRPAIRPYPSQYSWPARLRDGTTVTIRPIRPEDEPELARFHATLSEPTVYRRYLGHLKLSQRVAHARLFRRCVIDYDREAVLVAARGEGATSSIVGVGRLNPTGRAGEAEFALLIGDACQGRGLGSEMLARLLDLGRAEGLTRIVAEIAPDNLAMLAVCRRLGFALEGRTEDPTVRAARAL